MKDFDFLFGLLLGEQILKHTDNLSKTLQATAMSAVEAYSVAKLRTGVFKKIWTDDDFDLFWDLAKTTQNSLEVNDLVRVNVLDIMKMVLLNLTTLLMSNNITSKYTFRVLIQPLLWLKIIFSDCKTYSTLEQLIIIKVATKKDYLMKWCLFMDQILVNLNFSLNLSYLNKWKFQSVAITYNFVTSINQSLPPSQLSLLSSLSVCL